MRRPQRKQRPRALPPAVRAALADACALGMLLACLAAVVLIALTLGMREPIAGAGAPQPPLSAAGQP